MYNANEYYRAKYAKEALVESSDSSLAFSNGSNPHRTGVVTEPWTNLGCAAKQTVHPPARAPGPNLSRSVGPRVICTHTSDPRLKQTLQMNEVLCELITMIYD